MFNFDGQIKYNPSTLSKNKNILFAFIEPSDRIYLREVSLDAFKRVFL